MVKPCVGFYCRELREALAVKPQAKNKLPKKIPTEADETSLIRIKSAPGEFVAKRVRLTGVVAISSNYSGHFEGTEKINCSLDFRQLTANLEAANDEVAILYVNRKLAKALIDAIVSVEDTKGGGLIVRIEAENPHNSDLDYNWNKFAILDWQFLNKDGDGWSPWVLGRLAPASQLLDKLPPEAGAAIAEAILGGGQDAIGVTIQEALILQLRRASKKTKDNAIRFCRHEASKARQKELKQRATQRCRPDRE